MTPWSCVHTVHEEQVFCHRTVQHFLLQCIIINGISVSMQSSFFVDFLLELFHFLSMPKWPFGQREFLNSREICLCPFCCLNHSFSSTFSLGFCSAAAYSQCTSQEEWEGKNAFAIWDLSKAFHSGMMAGKLHHLYICLGKRKQTGKGFCRMMDSGVSICSKKNPKKYMWRYRRIKKYAWI